jgi:hypothetical protein
METKELNQMHKIQTYFLTKYRINGHDLERERKKSYAEKT